MAELFIYDDIGPDWLGMVSAKAFLEQLKRLDDDEPLTIRINSPGGDVNEAMAIYNAIARRNDTTVEIDGIAASAASYIAMAGKKIVIAENGMVMIHNPWSFAVGDSVEMRKKADILDKYGENIADVYASRSGKSREELTAAMTAETWYSASEAVEAGLADEIGQPLQVAASIAPGRFKNTPKPLENDEAAKAAQDQRRKARLGMYDARLRLTRAR